MLEEEKKNTENSTSKKTNLFIEAHINSVLSMQLKCATLILFFLIFGQDQREKSKDSHMLA